MHDFERLTLGLCWLAALADHSASRLQGAVTFQVAFGCHTAFYVLGTRTCLSFELAVFLYCGRSGATFSDVSSSRSRAFSVCEVSNAATVTSTCMLYLKRIHYLKCNKPSRTEHSQSGSSIELALLLLFQCLRLRAPHRQLPLQRYSAVLRST